PFGLLAPDLHALFGVPILLTIHGIDYRLQAASSQLRSAGAISKMALSCASILLVGSPLRSYAEKLGLDTARLRILHNGHEVVERKPVPVLRSRVRILSICNLQRLKGVDLVLKALGQLRDVNIENWSYDIIGDNPERERLKRMCCDLGLKRRVTF